ncbi:MAG: glycosyltransferase [Candidatus Omnitrophica bacterium]|nr:glycosyltransferase [Candidatus Omnitrophota bacterium]MBU0895688.1 glycosyltransferase [Candidatus Omnitrophota bacterium]MBU1808788.1 glycosyltransferase [Candidatus Omnitrophota bacterium]
MFDDKSKKYINTYVPLEPVDINEYKPFVDKELLEELRFMADPLKNKVWANVNSTVIGGGVAEMLQSVIPFARGLGVDARWFVIEGNDEFFSVTKKFHNLLQGLNQKITLEEIFHAYLDTIDQNTRDVRVVGHMVTIHDPQPAAIIMNGNVYGHTIWRCHIDTSHASRRIWRFLLPYINQYEGAIFSSKEFMKENVQIPAYEISPSIDPLKKKNRQRTREEALASLAEIFNENDIDPERPIVAAISRYDIHKNQKTIIEAFKAAKTGLKKGVNPILVIVGNSATDDPEGMKTYEEIREFAEDEKDIRLLLNVENNDEVIGSLMCVADCFIHISTREGFGLVVTEAMWQGTPVIGSKVGGIVKQVIDGHNGYLVEPHDVPGIAKAIRHILDDDVVRKTFSENARKTVRQQFLLPHMLKKELALMRYCLEIDNKIPDFRINKLAYKEIEQALYGRTAWPFSTDDLKKHLEIIQEGMESSSGST